MRHSNSRGPVSRRTVLEGATGAALLAPLLAACGGAPGASTEGGAGDAVEFVYLGDVNQREVFQALFDRFNDEQPDIDLHATAKSGSWSEFAYSVATQIAGGQAPDIIQIATEGQNLFASKGVLAPLDDRIADDQDVVDEYYDDIHDKLREWTQQHGSTDGSTYYIPGGYNPIVQFCNTDLLEKAGVDLPEKGWSWDELMEAGRKVKAQGAFLMTVEEGYWHDVLPWLTNNGASSLNDEWTESTINSPEAIEAAEMARALVAAGYAPDPGGNFDPPTLMQRGELAAFHDGAFGIANANRIEMTDSIRAVFFPHNDTFGTPVGWDAWDITRASDRKDESWEFIKYLMTPDAAKFFADTGGTIVPARRSVASSEAFLKNAPTGSQCLVDALELEGATPVPSPERGPEIQSIVEQGWLQVIAGYADARTQLNRSYDKIGPLL